MNKALILIVIFLSAIAGFGQKVSASGYRARATRTTITVTYRGGSHSFKAGDHIDAARVTGAKVLLASRIKNFTYLLLDVTGTSKAHGDMHECGAGTESNLIRVKLNSKWRVTEMDGVRYDSCWGSVVSEEGYAIKNGVFKIEYDDIRNRESMNLAYDANDPEAGFKIEKKKLEIK
jgi:hypothetical protein